MSMCWWWWRWSVLLYVFGIPCTFCTVCIFMALLLPVFSKYPYVRSVCCSRVRMRACLSRSMPMCEYRSVYVVCTWKNCARKFNEQCGASTSVCMCGALTRYSLLLFFRFVNFELVAFLFFCFKLINNTHNDICRRAVPLNSICLW